MPSVRIFVFLFENCMDDRMPSVRIFVFLFDVSFRFDLVVYARVAPPF